MVDDLFPCKQKTTTQKYRDGYDLAFGKKEEVKEADNERPKDEEVRADGIST